MANRRYRIERLGDHHDRAAFVSGVEALDRYFRERAGQEVRKHIAAVHVLYDTEAEAVAGYYTLSATGVEAIDLPSDITRKLPRYPLLPAVLIGRLAVSVDYRGQRFGELLLMDALWRTLAHQSEFAAMAVIVDAKDDPARAFCEHYNFRRFSTESYRLFLPMQTIAKMDWGDR